MSARRPRRRGDERGGSAGPVGFSAVDFQLRLVEADVANRGVEVCTVGESGTVSKKPKDATAIYVAFSKRGKGPTKIGISNKPDIRLQQFQSGFPTQLEMKVLAWMKTRKIAAQLEAWALKQFTILSGEWLAQSAEELEEKLRDHFIKHIGVRHLWIDSFPATDDEVLGLICPRDGTIAAEAQFRRLGDSLRL